VPTVPEPHEWALIVIACVALMWLVRRRRSLFQASGSESGSGPMAVA